MMCVMHIIPVLCFCIVRVFIIAVYFMVEIAGHGYTAIGMK